jgi:tetratricopeptide (TPR) repeat protein
MKLYSLKFLLVQLPVAGIFILLTACASVGGGGASSSVPMSAKAAALATSTAHFPEWSVITISVGDSGKQAAASPAVIKLTGQADKEIARSDWKSAQNTLERLLRIAPDYAPGWSRMAWLALQAGKPERARELATRSNSYATGRIDLKLLNWQFFRQASVMLNDQGEIQRADRNIHALENL